jgi:flagellar assembly protein FliH
MSEPNILPMTDLFRGAAKFTARHREQPVALQPNCAEERYRQGLADGQCLAEAAFAAERERLHQLIANAEAIRVEGNPEIAFLLGNAVRRIVQNIVGDIALDPVFLTGQIEEAVALLVEADQARHICLHPDDIALLADISLPLPCKPDHALPRGAIRIECSAGWVEHGPAFILQRLQQALPLPGDAR